MIENHNSHNSPLPICDYVRLFSSPLDKGLYVGCGNGRNAFPLLSEGWNLYACDVSNFNIQRAQKYLPQYADRFEALSYDQAFSYIPEFDYVICSRALVYGSFEESLQRFKILRRRLRPSGILLFQLPAIGKDLWPKWVNYAITEMGSLIVGYNLHSPSKVYLSFTDVCDLLERAGFKICNGPTPYDLPRGEYPGGIVRNWLGAAINNN